MKARIIITAIVATLAAVNLWAANELTVLHTLTYVKGGVSSTISESKGITINTAGYLDAVVVLTTNESQYSFGTITNVGVVFIKNLNTDTNQTVLAGSTQGVYMVLLKSSETWPIRLNGTNLFLKASTNSTLVRVAAFPN
jgi:hypothetical protein